MSFTHILFDLDGTTLQSPAGRWQLPEIRPTASNPDGYSEEILDRFIGPPLQDGFKNLFGLNERNTELAVEHFRTYFGEKGLYENEPYPGVLELLEDALSKETCICGGFETREICPTNHASFEFDRYLDGLIGAEYGKHSGKGQLYREQLLQQ